MFLNQEPCLEIIQTRGQILGLEHVVNLFSILFTVTKTKEGLKVSCYCQTDIRKLEYVQLCVQTVVFIGLMQDLLKWVCL